METLSIRVYVGERQYFDETFKHICAWVYAPLFLPRIKMCRIKMCLQFKCSVEIEKSCSLLIICFSLS